MALSQITLDSLTFPLFPFPSSCPSSTQGTAGTPALLREAEKHYKVRNHPNVINFLGLVANPSASEPIGMLMELADGCALNVLNSNT
jgi:hypothetical protein